MPSHKLKFVQFYGSEVPIVLQNENGPCPMLAIANVLLLRQDIQLPADTYDVEQEKLLAILGEYLLDSNEVESHAQDAANLQQNLQDVISNMHKLTTGVDVNPKFSSVRGFEFTNETAIFDLFGVSLVHGWIMDPEEDAASLVGEMSYNQVVSKLISTLGAAALTSAQTNVAEEPPLIDLGTEGSAPSTPPTVACELVATERGVELRLDVIRKDRPVESAVAGQDPGEIRNWEIVQSWLMSHSSQLSTFGLFQLYQQLPENNLAVFFRNNHFSTIFKENNAIYILVTDQGYLSESRLVWEKLESVNNDNQFFTGEFKVFKRETGLEEDRDLQYALAASLNRNPGEPAPSSTLLPSDFLSVTPEAPAPRTSKLRPGEAGRQIWGVDMDADLALAMHLQEQEEAEAAAQSRSRQSHQESRDPQLGWGGLRPYPPGHARAASGEPIYPSPGQHAAGTRATRRHRQSRGGSADATAVPVSANADHPPPETMWRRFWRIMKF